MPIFLAGKYKARMAETEADVTACQQLRYLAFIEERGLGRADDTVRLDRDSYDADCRHVMVEEVRTAKLVCCFRLLPLPDGSAIARSYSARYYNLSRLAAYPGGWSRWGGSVSTPPIATPTSCEWPGAR